ncbi:hypothetical protein GmHk_03G008937 [Glycine max]|nr:hypothetical protein GmHk_03G008937 [Glycine max]
MDEERRNQKDSIWWKDLCAVCGAIEEGKWFNNAVRWKLGSGKNIKFWEDGWVGGGESMLGKYPRLYSILEQQHHGQKVLEQALFFC